MKKMCMVLVCITNVCASDAEIKEQRTQALLAGYQKLGTVKVPEEGMRQRQAAAALAQEKDQVAAAQQILQDATLSGEKEHQAQQGWKQWTFEVLREARATLRDMTGL